MTNLKTAKPPKVKKLDFKTEVKNEVAVETEV